MKRIIFIGLISLTMSFSTAWSQSAKTVDGVGITVSDLAEAIDFYTQVLPFELISRDTLAGTDMYALFDLTGESLQIEVARLALGEETIELMAFNGVPAGRTIPVDAQSNDQWFQHIAIVVSDMEAAYAKLRAAKVTHVSSMPQTLPAYLPAAAGISAFYFRDPDAHNLEIIHFPSGKGNPKWQQAKGEVFLGVDHTAIGIGDTEISQAFYEQLGLKVAGGSENYGPEQAQLNMVFGAHLIITGLVAQAGPGVEFLEYLSPPGGRPYPTDSRATDLWHWHTHIRVKAPGDLYEQLQAAGADILSRGIVSIEEDFWPFKQGFLVRDPDGHAILITD